MGSFADLHLHTVHSDGTYSPEEIVDKAIADGVKVISITDHDSVGGILKAIEYSRGKLQVISGIELSAEINDADIHILGYFFDHNDPKFLKQIEVFKSHREERAFKIVEKLKNENIKLEFDYVKKISGEGVIGRLHIAVALHQLGYVKTIQESFEKYLGDQSSCYVAKYKMTPKEAIDFIKSYGGVSVWAHPGCSQKDHLLDIFVKDGLSGLEVYHPRHNDVDTKKYLKLAKKNNLLVTGGTDFHGKYRAAKLGEFGLNEEMFNVLLQKK